MSKNMSFKLYNFAINKARPCVAKTSSASPRRHTHNKQDKQMDKQPHKYIAALYKLYTVNDDGQELVQETPADNPFEFISGMDMAIDPLENTLTKLNAGEKFDLFLPKADAFGDYLDERVVDLERKIFSINGHFDHDNIYIDAVVPLKNSNGEMLLGRILNITDTHVRVDLNHPLAGNDVRFTGSVVTSREATDEDVQHMRRLLKGEGCGCRCGECGGECGEHRHCGEETDQCHGHGGRKGHGGHNTCGCGGCH